MFLLLSKVHEAHGGVAMRFTEPNIHLSRVADGLRVERQFSCRKRWTAGNGDELSEVVEKVLSPQIHPAQDYWSGMYVLFDDVDHRSSG